MSETPRQLVWFSCGAASAVAAKLSPGADVLYCDTLAYEHPDNTRFLLDVAAWIGRPVKILKSPDYTDIYDVFHKTRWLIGTKGARCTTELKKNVRKAFQLPDDVHVFGYTADEQHRVDRLHRENPEIYTRFPLIENGIHKDECFVILRDAGIELPTMYKMGYRNNNCIGCVKGGKGYWNKIRRDFPETFAKMAATERTLGAAICKNEGVSKLTGKRWRGCSLMSYPRQLGDTRKNQISNVGFYAARTTTRDQGNEPRILRTLQGRAMDQLPWEHGVPRESSRGRERLSAP